MGIQESPDGALRQEATYRRLGTRDPACRTCGETDWRALTGTDPDILCYICDKARRGQAPLEQHHVAGQHNSGVTVPVDANVHRILSDAQRDWPRTTLTNPTQSPLIQAAAALRGFMEWVRTLMDRVLGWIPPFLEQVDHWLTAQHGAEWWTQLPLGDES